MIFDDMQKLKISDKISDIIDIIDINDINTIRWCSKYHKLLIVLLYATTISKIPILAIFGHFWLFLAHRFDVWMKGKTKQRQVEVLKEKVKVPQKLLVIKNPQFWPDWAEILTQRSFRSDVFNEPIKSGISGFFEVLREKRWLSRKFGNHPIFCRNIGSISS